LQVVDPKTGAETPVVISADDGIRPNATVEELGKLRPVFKKDGSTTAGNSSQVGELAGHLFGQNRSLERSFWLAECGTAGTLFGQAGMQSVGWCQFASLHYIRCHRTECFSSALQAAY
jgi:hypothetical protein